MAFTQTATDFLKNYAKKITYTVQARSSHPESSSWTSLTILKAGFSLVRDREELGSTLVLTLPADVASFYSELDPTNPLAIFSEIRLIAQIAGEQETLFQGFITEISEEKERLQVFAVDHCYRLTRGVSGVDVEGVLTSEISNAPLYSLPDEFDDHTYGFRQDLTPDGFSPEGKRRAWKALPFRMFDGGNEILPDFYRVYPQSGVVRFLDPLPSSPTIESVYCYVEGTSDVSEAIIQAITYPREKGGAGVDPLEIDLPNISTDLNRLMVSHGSMLASEFLLLLEDFVPQNYYFFYDSDEQKFKHKLLTQAVQPDREIINLAGFRRIRTRENIYTNVLVRGRKPVPDNLALSATVTDLQPGVGEIYRWNGSDKVFGEGSIDLIRDADDNSGFGRHNAPFSYGYYDFAQFDLGLDADGNPPIVSAVEITSANSKNVNSQSSGNSKFSYGYQVLGSRNGVSFEAISPQGEILAEPLSRVLIEAFPGSRFRYIKLRVKPAKDGVSNENDPGLAVNEVRIFGDEYFSVEAKVQGTDPLAKFYYPELLEKTDGVGPQVLLVDVGEKLAEAEAKRLAEELLEYALTDYLAFEVVSISDPTLRIGQTVQVRHPVTADILNFLVERLEITPSYTKVYGRDFNAEVLR